VRQHVVIRRETYVAGTRERPEVGIFTQTHSTRPPVPWNRIAVGDPVGMKWSGGPVVARARVQGFRQIAGCSIEQLHATTLGFRLYDLADYWASLREPFFALTVYLSDEQWLDEPIIPAARSRGESCIVAETAEQERAWLSQADTGGSATAPSDSQEGGRRGTRTISLSLRFKVLRGDDFACVYCGRRAPEVVLHLDHTVPWAAGGPTTLDNLRTACSDCNLGKGTTRLHNESDNLKIRLPEPG
jgi:hypothetical protein